jgi:phage shock protein A
MEERVIELEKRVADLEEQVQSLLNVDETEFAKAIINAVENYREKIGIKLKF